MYKKTKILFVSMSFLILIFLVIKFYFSENNIIKTNKFRSIYALESTKDINYLPILENDTDNIITYKDDIEIYKKKRKKYFWEKLISE
jgi:hypothetical protein|tara:strand:+ start:593 stop:856 length:264 start_codon:yes stop_codon:yes gene_type:complete